MQGQALTMALDLGRSRVLLFKQLDSSIPVPFLVVLVFWLAIIFASFGLFAPRNGTVVAVRRQDAGLRLARAAPVLRVRGLDVDFVVSGTKRG